MCTNVVCAMADIVATKLGIILSLPSFIPLTIFHILHEESGKLHIELLC